MEAFTKPLSAIDHGCLLIMDTHIFWSPWLYCMKPMTSGPKWGSGVISESVLGLLFLLMGLIRFLRDVLFLMHLCLAHGTWVINGPKWRMISSQQWNHSFVFFSGTNRGLTPTLHFCLWAVLMVQYSTQMSCNSTNRIGGITLQIK